MYRNFMVVVYSDVTGVSEECYKGITLGLQWYYTCYRGVTVV
jgi:hypothetical protein